MHGHQKGWYSLSSTGPQGNVEKLGYSHIWSFLSNEKLHEHVKLKENLVRQLVNDIFFKKHGTKFL